MTTDQTGCRQLPLDVLGVVAATYVRSPYELHLFAAVSRTWLRAVATSEHIHAKRLAAIAINDTFLDPARDTEMWMLEPLTLALNKDIDGLNAAMTSATGMFDAKKFLVREMLVERAAMCGLEYLRVNTLTPEISMMLERMPDDGIHTLSLSLANASDTEAAVSFLKRCRARTSLKIRVTKTVNNLLQGSFDTLSSLSITVGKVVPCILDNLPRLEQLTVNEQEIQTEVRAALLTSIGKLHQLKDLRLKLSAWDESWRSWPSKLRGLTRLETLEVQSGAYEADLVFDGVGFGESLTFLNLAWISNNVTTATAVSVANTFPRLKVLHATMCEENTIGDAGYASIGSKLKELVHLELWMNELSFSQLQSLSGLEHLELLSIAGAKFDDTATSDELVEVWSSMPSLTALGLDDMHWTATLETCNGLLDSLVACKKLKMLNLDGVGAWTVDSGGLESDALGYLTELESISLANAKLKPDTIAELSRHTNLKIIMAANTLWSPEESLSQLIRNNCTQLAVFSFQGCTSIEAEHIVLLGTLCRRLDSLDVSCRERNPWAHFAEGVDALGDVPFFPSLTKLVMGGGTWLNDDDVATILHRTHALEVLDLSRSSALTMGLLPVLAASRVGRCKLEACHGLADPVSVLEAMLKGNPRLHTFEMQNVEQIQLPIEDAVAPAAERHPRLQRVHINDGVSNQWQRTPAPQLV